MKVVAAYLLLTLGGNTAPSASDIQTVLKSVGSSAEDDHVNKLITALKGKNVADVIAAGTLKLASVPSGGSSSGGSSGSGEAKEEAKEEEKKVEKSESEDGEMGMGLFGDESESD